MNNIHTNSLCSRLIAMVAFAALSVSAFAGPGPQAWIKSPAPAPVAKAKATEPAKCEQCKAASKWVSDRGPVSKGTSGRSSAGKTPGCNICAEVIVAQAAKTKTATTKP